MKLEIACRYFDRIIFCRNFVSSKDKYFFNFFSKTFVYAQARNEDKSKNAKNFYQMFVVCFRRRFHSSRLPKTSIKTGQNSKHQIKTLLRNQRFIQKKAEKSATITLKRSTKECFSRCGKTSKTNVVSVAKNNRKNCHILSLLRLDWYSLKIPIGDSVIITVAFVVSLRKRRHFQRY